MAVDDQLEHRHARGLDSFGFAGIVLDQAVDQIKLGANRVASEVHDDIAPPGHAETQPMLVEQRRREQIAVVGDIGEGLHDIVCIDQIELIDTTRAAIEQA
jgi:hypothetical protein